LLRLWVEWQALAIISKMKDHPHPGHLFFLYIYSNDYAYWKARMIIYLQSIDFDLWLSVENWPHKPIKIENDIEFPKTRSECTKNDKKKRLLSMDIKAMNTL
jgi:hypothetical protein